MQRIEQQIWSMIEPGIDDLGLRLVRVLLSGKERQVLQIMIEPKEAMPHNRLSVTVEDCEKVSRMISALLDVEDPISGGYNLEVSSTGIDRPLVTEQDFEVYAGANAKVEMTAPVNGQRRFKGQLLGMTDGNIRIRCDDGLDAELPYGELKKAKLVYTDEELANLFKG